MKQRRRIYYSEKDKALMWDRWKKGDSFKSNLLSIAAPCPLQSLVKLAKGKLRPYNLLLDLR